MLAAANFIASLPYRLLASPEAPPSAESTARTPAHATMRDPSASAIPTLKRAAPVEDGLMPEQFYTLNPEFLTDAEKFTYRDLQVCDQPGSHLALLSARHSHASPTATPRP